MRRAVDLVFRVFGTSLPFGNSRLHRLELASRLRGSLIQRVAQARSSRRDILFGLRQQILRYAVDLLIQLFGYARERGLQFVLPAILGFGGFVVDLRDALFAQASGSLFDVATQLFAARPRGIVSREISGIRLRPVRQGVR